MSPHAAQEMIFDPGIENQLERSRDLKSYAIQIWPLNPNYGPLCAKTYGVRLQRFFFSWSVLSAADGLVMSCSTMISLNARSFVDLRWLSRSAFVVICCGAIKN